MRRLLKRLGRRKLSREVPGERVRRGHRVDGLTRVGLLVPAVDFAQRKELKELVLGLQDVQETLDWMVWADTGMTRRAYAKSRAQRIQKLGAGQEVPPDFPQESRLSCFWRDDCSALGLPMLMPDGLHDVDVLITLDASSANLPLRAMMRRSKAPFKVGPKHADDGTLDFMLSWPDGEDMQSFAHLAFHYLKTLDLK